ncbi:30S ribosomal protein S8e [archaeon]|nr:30S ribosomal protein S8e [archaeon]|tara:strand:- start:3837 stop:4220 length:384 start_codon:yes stop_codon:yes gene_type:complete
MSTKWQLQSKKQKTGALKGKKKKHKKYERARDTLHTSVEDTRRVKIKRMRGGSLKKILIATKQANVIVNGKAEKAEITSVVENSANKDYIRRNVITKGAIIETDKGKAVVTSRPGQHGTVNAKLIKE